MPDSYLIYIYIILHDFEWLTLRRWMSKCITYCVNDDTNENRAQKFTLRFNTFYSLNSDFDLVACIFKMLQLSSVDPDTSICFWYWWWCGGGGAAGWFCSSSLLVFYELIYPWVRQSIVTFWNRYIVSAIFYSVLAI